MTWLLAQIEESFWLPPPASTSSAIVDNLFYILLGVSVFFFTLIIVLMTIFVILFRRREGVEPSPSPSHNTALELVWTHHLAARAAYLHRGHVLGPYHLQQLG